MILDLLLHRLKMMQRNDGGTAGFVLPPRGGELNLSSRIIRAQRKSIFDWR